jgi:hypothetical protein
MVASLVRRGANLDVAVQYGKTPMRLAIDKGMYIYNNINTIKSYQFIFIDGFIINT